MDGSVKVDRGRLPVRIAEDDHWWFASRTRALQAVVADVVGHPTTLRVLDVGCGAGNMYHHLSRYGDVIGVENHPSPVRVGQQRGYDIRQADGSRLPFEAGSFDLVSALDVIEHNQDDQAMLAEMFRVLKPGGHVLISVPAFQWLWSFNDDLNKHVRRYTADGLQKKLAGVGFQPLRTTYNNFFVFPLAAAMILASRVRSRPDLQSHYFDDDAYQVDMQPAHPLVNTILQGVGVVEARLIRRLDLPVGTGLIGIGRK